MQNFCACPHRAAPSGGPGVGTGAGEFADPHGGGGGREQRRQRHRRPGEQTSSETATARTRTARAFIEIFFHTALFSAPIFSVGGVLKRLEKQIERQMVSPLDARSIIRAGPSARSFSADFVYHAARLHHRAPRRGAYYLLTADAINCPRSPYLPIPGL